MCVVHEQRVALYNIYFFYDKPFTRDLERVKNKTEIILTRRGHDNNIIVYITVIYDRVRRRAYGFRSGSQRISR